MHIISFRFFLILSSPNLVNHPHHCSNLYFFYECLSIFWHVKLCEFIWVADFGHYFVNGCSSPDSSTFACSLISLIRLYLKLAILQLLQLLRTKDLRQWNPFVCISFEDWSKWTNFFVPSFNPRNNFFHRPFQDRNEDEQISVQRAPIQYWHHAPRKTKQ